MFENRQRRRNSRSENTRRLYLLKDGVLGHLEMVWKRWKVGIISSINSVKQNKSGSQSRISRESEAEKPGRLTFLARPDHDEGEEPHLNLPRTSPLCSHVFAAGLLPTTGCTGSRRGPASALTDAETHTGVE